MDNEVKIPKGISGITLKKIKGVTYVYYVYERDYDPERKYSVPRMTSIGKRVDSRPGMMYPNANYYRFFPDAELPKENANSKGDRTAAKKTSSGGNGSGKRISELELRNIWQAFEKSGRTYEELVAFLRGED